MGWFTLYFILCIKMKTHLIRYLMILLIFLGVLEDQPFGNVPTCDGINPYIYGLKRLCFTPAQYI